MKQIIPHLSLLLIVLPTFAIAAPQRINLNIPFNTDVLVIKNKTINIRAHCLQNNNGNDVLRVYTTTTSQHVVLDGLDDYNGSPYPTSATPETDARLMEIESPTGVFLAQTPPSNGGIVVDTDQHGGKIAFSPDSAGMAVGTPVSATKLGCFLTLPIEKIDSFKTVTK